MVAQEIYREVCIHYIKFSLCDIVLHSYENIKPLNKVTVYI